MPSLVELSKSQLSSGKYVAASALSADQRLLLGAQLRRGAWRRNAAARRGEVRGFGVQRRDRLWGARYKGREGKARKFMMRDVIDEDAPTRELPKPFRLGMKQHFRRGVPSQFRRGFVLDMPGAGAAVGYTKRGRLAVGGSPGVWGEKTPGLNPAVDALVRRQMGHAGAQFHAGAHEAGHAATASQVRRGRLRSPYRLAQIQTRPMAWAREEARVDAPAVRGVRRRGLRGMNTGYVSPMGWLHANQAAGHGKPTWLLSDKGWRLPDRQAKEFARLRTKLGAPLGAEERAAAAVGRTELAGLRAGYRV